MKNPRCLPLLLGVLVAPLIGGKSWAAPMGTAFTYLGWFKDGGVPAEGRYDFRFELFTMAAGGSQVGSTVFLNNLLVEDGMFRVPVNFGEGVFTGQAYWLQIAVRLNGSSGGYTLLSPRQQITPVAYALYAASGPGASGDIEAVTAGTGLTGGGTAGAVTLGILLPMDLSASTSGDTAVIRGFNLGAGYGLYGLGGPNYGIYGQSVSVAGVFGYSGSSAGVSGINGSWGNTGSLGDNQQGVYGMGMSLNSYGVYGTHNSTTNYGYLGGRIDGVHGRSYASGGSGVAGIHEGSGNGVYGRSAGGFAGRFDGNLYVGGNVQVGGNAGIGTSSPQEKLHVAGRFALVQGAGGEQAYLGGDGWGGDVQIGSLNANVTNVTLYNAGNDTLMHLNVKSLTITGGADLAEPFPIVERDIPKGSVVVIDENNPGHLKRSEQACDTRVAGILSGARGVHPGISLHQQGVLEQGQLVALSGRVYALADADFGPIKPGDLLTTSDTPGHAMKVTDHTKARGAILGKAMTPLPEGRGMVLVLVSLQ